MNTSDKLLSALALFTLAKPEWTVEDASRRLGLAVSTTYRYFRSLNEAGLTVAFAAGRYVLGPAIIALDRQARLLDPLIRTAAPVMRRLDEWDPAEGLRLAFTDPTTGASPIRTMGAFMQLLPRGFEGTPIRSTDGTVYAVVEGRGTVTAGAERWDVARGDVFVVPSWCWHSFAAPEDLVLFSFSDRPLQTALGFWREERR